MERCFKKYDRECMKMAMLKQEETFRHQVHELHRLYRVQKLLMNDMKNAELKRQQHLSAQKRIDRERLNVDVERATPKKCYSYREPRQTFNLELPAEECNGKDEGNVMIEAEEGDELELTLATGSRRRKKKDVSLNSDSGVTFSSSSESSGAKFNTNDWRMLQVPEMNLSYQNERKSGFDVEEQMRQGRGKYPPWLFQCLSLNVT